jgi:hypothetical protein
MTLEELYQNVSNIDAEALVKDILKKNEKKIVLYNTEQMYAGFDSNNNNIEPNYSNMTKRIKASKGQPIDRVTLKDTGDFHKSLKVKDFEIISTDVKAKSLQSKYGADILGTSPEDQSEINETIINPQLEDAINKAINL